MVKKPEPPKRSHHKRKPETEPPPGVLPPLPVASSELDPPLNLNCADPRPEKEPFWHSLIFIDWVLVAIVGTSTAIILWELTPRMTP